MQECPDEKTVGDTCYTKVAMIDTTEYGCMENCTYKKTQGSDSGLYCFKPGILPVTESECVYNGTDITITDTTVCIELENTQAVTGDAHGIPGYFPFHSKNKETCAYYCYYIVPVCTIWNYNYEFHLCWLMTSPGPGYPFKGAVLGNKACGAESGITADTTGGYIEEAHINIGVTCGSGVRKDFCFQCEDTFDSCQGADLHPDCILDNKICIPNNRECVPPFRPGPGSDGQPNSLCYYFSNTLVNTWEDAQKGCQRMRSNLAPVNNSTQQDFIVKVLDSTTSNRTFIGGTSTSDLKFYWLLTSTAVDDGFSFWGPGEPNFEVEQCMEMDKNRYPQPWMWNNVKCGTPYVTGLRSYVCAYDPNPTQ